MGSYCMHEIPKFTKAKCCILKAENLKYKT